MNSDDPPKRQLSGHTYLVINRRHNYGNKILADCSSHQGAFYLGIERADGDERDLGVEWKFVKWLGFIERREAKLLGEAAASVRLVNITRLGYESRGSVQWEDVAPGDYLHGCLTAEGVYGVYDANLALVGRRKEKTKARFKCVDDLTL